VGAEPRQTDDRLGEAGMGYTEIDRYRPDTELVEYRKRLDPEVAEQVDVESLGVLDLVDILDN
jgi:hypothetical protein